MDNQLERIYLGEIQENCRCGILAALELNRALSSTRASVDDFFKTAQDLLQHAAAISRIIWPSSSKSARAKARSAHLQSVLGVDGSHPLNSRALRNHLEHIDERLDDWAEQSSHRNLINKAIVQRREMIALGSALSNKDILRLYETETNYYVFRGVDFDVQAICSGVSDVLNKSSERLKILRP